MENDLSKKALNYIKLSRGKFDMKVLNNSFYCAIIRVHGLDLLV